MDLLLIGRKIWRYKLATLPLLLLTLLAAVYVLTVKEPVYEAHSSYILLNPPAPPTPEEVARDPALGRLNANNPYTRFTDQAVIVEVLASTMGSDSMRRALVKAGVDRRYTVAPSAEFAYSSPIVEITGVGTTPRMAIRSARLVGDAVTGELERMQQAEGVDPRYRIKSQQVDVADGAELRASGQLRMLVGVLALGAILLFVVVSIADAVSSLRRGRRERKAPSGPAANDEPWSEGGLSDDLDELQVEDWAGRGEDALPDGELVELFSDPDPEATGPTNRTRARGPYRRQRHSSGQ